MSDKPAPKDTVGAPTILDTLQQSRISRGQKPVATKTEDQFKVTSRNPNADPLVDPSQNIRSNRRVQQGGEDGGGEGGKKPDEKENEAQKKAEEYFRQRLFGDRRKPAQEKPDAGKKSGEEAGANGGKQGEESAKDKGQGKPKPAATTVRQPRIGRDELAAIAQAAATAATAAVAATGKTSAKEEEAGSEPDLSSLDKDDRYSYDVATYMAKESKDYANLPQAMLEMSKRKLEYRKAWEEENPNQEFSWEDESHASFLEKITPEFNERDFEDARISMKADKIAERRLQTANERIAQLEQKTTEGSLKETIGAEVKSSVAGLHKELAPSAEFDLTTKSGRQKAAEDEPLIGPIAAKYAEILEDATSELVKLYDGGGKFKMDPKNDMHVWMARVVDDYEDALMQAPPEKLANKQGQTFVPRDEYSKMSEKEQRKHWTILRDQAMWIVRRAVADAAKTERDSVISQQERVAKKYGYRFDRESLLTQRRSARQNPDGIDEGGDEATRLEVSRGEVDSPTADAGGKTDTSSGDLRKDNEKFADMMMSKLFPRYKKAE